MPATTHLSTTSGTIERRNGYVAQTLHVFADTLGQETVKVSTVDDVRTAVQAFGVRLRAMHPASSFLVSIMIQRGSRKPNGCDAATLAREFGAKPAEIRTFLAGTLGAERTRELTDQMRAADAHPPLAWSMSMLL